MINYSLKAPQIRNQTTATDEAKHDHSAQNSPLIVLIKSNN